MIFLLFFGKNFCLAVVLKDIQAFDDNKKKKQKENVVIVQ